MKTIVRNGRRGGLRAVMPLALACLLSAGCEVETSSRSGLGSGHDFGDNDPNLVIALGDSVTRGKGLRPYPSILGEMIGLRVVNAGVGGNRARDGAARLSGVLNQKPGYVLILFGLNDAFHGGRIEDTVNALRGMIYEVRRNGSIPALGTLPPQNGSYSFMSGHVAALNEEIVALGREQLVRVADISGTVGLDGISRDGLHPNQDGLRAIAAAFADLF